MSILTSSDEYTEDELLRVCEELGLPCDEERIACLKNAIDEIVDDSDTGSEEGPHDGSLFGGLSLSDSAPSTVGSTGGSESFSSPIRHRERNPSRLSFGGASRYCNTEVPLNLPTSQENEELRRHNPTAYYLLNDAWRCLSNVYGTMSMMEDLQVKLTSTRRASSQGRPTRLQIPRLLKDEDKENRGNFPRCDKSGPSYYRGSAEEPTESNAFCENSSIPERENFHLDPSIRRVNRFVPGQLLYRHDPVKRFELYKEEWARKPAPGEQKRLALRWKVREYMLRHDVPLYDPRKQIAEHAAHPKDWSPRPYLE